MSADTLSFNQKLQAKWSEGKFVCVGLDPDIAKLPFYFDTLRHDELSKIGLFLESIIQSTRNIVCAYKPNTAFFEAYGSGGIRILEIVIDYIHATAPDVPIILDAKRADIGNTNEGYARFAFDQLECDAITVHPYLGHEAMEPFLKRSDKGVIVLVRTSNPGAGEFQDLGVDMLANAERWGLTEPGFDTDNIHLHSSMQGLKLFQAVAETITRDWNYNGNVSVVVGATYPEELAIVRQIVGDLPILIPGVGAQGGDLEKAVTNGANSDGKGFVINLSRSVLYATQENHWPQAARTEVESINSQIAEARAS